MPAAWTRRQKRNKTPTLHEPARLDLRLPVRNPEIRSPNAKDADEEESPPRGVAVVDFYL